MIRIVKKHDERKNEILNTAQMLFYKNSHTAPSVEGYQRTYCLLLLYLFISREYCGTGAPVSLKTIAISLQIPTHFVHELLGDLIDCDILAESKNKKNSYEPAKPFSAQGIPDLLSSIQQRTVPEEVLPSQKNTPLH